MGLDAHGITPSGTVWWNLTAPALYEHAIAAGDAEIAEGGPLVVSTGVHTGRAPKDKFVVREPGSEDRVWWGDINQPISPEHHTSLGERLRAHLAGANDLYVIDSYAGADPKEQLSVRIVTESPWHALFAQTLFRVPDDEELEGFQPQALILHAPSFTADGPSDGVRQDNFVSLHLSDLEILIGGTELRRRDQEVDLHGDELPAAAARGAVDALLGQRRRRRRRGAVLRPLRHREDDALRRPDPPR